MVSVTRWDGTVVFSMPNHPVPCPLCADAPLVRHPHERFECAAVHGFFALEHTVADGHVEAALKHETTGIEFGMGSFTPKAWRVFLRGAGVHSA